MTAAPIHAAPLLAANDMELAGGLAAEIIAEPLALRAEIDALIERAFGPGRYAKTAERLREGNAIRAELSFVAVSAGAVVGAVRLWPVMVGEARGLFLGPIAVEGGWRKHGLGAALIETACVAATAADERFILLVGDLPLFGPHGFEVAPAGRAILPGPVDARRVLWRETRAGGLDGATGRVHVPRHG
jgi:predicted N-acetyltransferase YhbS